MIIRTTIDRQALVDNAVDIALFSQVNGTLDISIDEYGDLAKTNDIDTAIYMSLLTDKRADSSEISLPQLRRGWWGNTLNAVPYEIGSKLWLLEQSRRIQDTLNKAQQHITDSLNWLITDNLVKKINVDVYFVEEGIEAKVTFE